jgi:hypothetical protein
MRLQPGGALPAEAPILVVDGEYAGYEGTVIGTVSIDDRLDRYRVLIKRPEEEPGMEFDTYVPASFVKLRR